MATNMAPHNLTEVIDACTLLLTTNKNQIATQQTTDQTTDKTTDQTTDQTTDENAESTHQVLEDYPVSIDEIMEVIK
mgnify:CR=1 FL=1